MMNFELLCIVLAASTAVLGLLYFQTKSALEHAQYETSEAQEDLSKALDAASRADERSEETKKLIEDLKARPVQVMIPHDAINIMTNAILQNLSQSLNAPMEVPIFPREKPPQEPKQ